MTSGFSAVYNVRFGLYCLVIEVDTCSILLQNSKPYGFRVLLMLLYTPVLFYSKAKILDVSQTSCLKIKDLIPDTQDGLYVFYIRMDGSADFKTWKHLATCLRMWDLDARGFHNGMWRFWLKKNHVIVVGCPASKYCTHKPADLEPLYIPETVMRPIDD